MNSDKARKWAEACFKKQERARDAQAAMTEYEAGARATREKTAHLKELRLAKEAEAIELPSIRATRQTQPRRLRARGFSNPIRDAGKVLLTIHQ